jgi:hypothetical protein
VVADGKYPRWEDSPLSNLFKMKDICYYKPGDVNKNGKEGKTSWDSFSYALLMGHNVWMHLTAVQEANRRFDAGAHPAMMRSSGPGGEYFEDIVEAIFAAPDKATSMEIIDMYKGDTGYWCEIVGTRGFKGKKAVNGSANFSKLFYFEDDVEIVEETTEQEFDQTKLDALEAE